MSTSRISLNTKYLTKQGFPLLPGINHIPNQSSGFKLHPGEGHGPPTSHRPQLSSHRGQMHPIPAKLHWRMTHMEMVSPQQDRNLEQFLLGKGGAGCSKVPQVLDELSSSRAGDGDNRAHPAGRVSTAWSGWLWEVKLLFSLGAVSNTLGKGREDSLCSSCAVAVHQERSYHTVLPGTFWRVQAGGDLWYLSTLSRLQLRYWYGLWGQGDRPAWCKKWGSFFW